MTKPDIQRVLLFCFLILIAHWSSISGEDKSPSNFPGVFPYKDFDVAKFKLYEPAKAPIDFKRINYALLNASLFYETNRIRLLNDLKELKHSEKIEQAAAMHARDMVKQSFYGHLNVHDEDKVTVTKRLSLYRVPRGTTGENLAKSFGLQYESGARVRPPHHDVTDFIDPGTNQVIPPHTYTSLAETVVGAWMESPSHRANILSKDFRKMGCGAFFYIDDDFYGMPMFRIVQDFWSPASVRYQQFLPPLPDR